MSEPTETVGRLDALLMRVLDGEATSAEREELLELADADERLAAHERLRVALRTAIMEVADTPVDVVGEVLEALSIEDGWGTISDALRSEVMNFDISDSVMAAIETPALEVLADEPPPEEEVVLSALFDGEVSVQERMALANRIASDTESRDTLNAYAQIGRLMRQSVEAEAKHVDLSGTWAAVAQAIGVEDPEHVEGWEPVGQALKDAVLAEAHMSQAESAELTEDILVAVRPRELVVLEPEAPEDTVELQPAQARHLLPAMAMAAMALVFAVPFLSPSDEGPTSDEPVATEELQLDFAEINQAEVENLEYAQDVFVHVIQDEGEGAPMIIFIEEEAPMDDDLEDTGGAL
ncbi:MAG: RseA family anti-sigma factor [Myxococcota bacterium]|nr:RseA family anti-sigma factor [Myxococcota bacterium]